MHLQLIRLLTLILLARVPSFSFPFAEDRIYLAGRHCWKVGKTLYTNEHFPEDLEIRMIV